MRTNPLLDSLRYLVQIKSWTTVTFDLLLLAGIVIAALAFRHSLAQRSAYHLWIWIARTVLGAMWWQQVIWKVPPDFAGLRFWTAQMVPYAASDLQRTFVSHVVLPHFSLFAPLVFAIEVVISVTLLLGLWARLGALLGAAMALNLSLGLYRSPSEWPWQYIFLIIVMVQFVAVPPGRSLGLDALLTGSLTRAPGSRSRLLQWVR